MKPVARLGFAFNPTNPAAVEVKDRAMARCRTAGLDHWATTAADLETLLAELPSTDALIVLGGDGTFLLAARAVIEVMQCDAAARRRAVEQCGGQITADGTRAKRAMCPSCGRGSVWWYIDSDGPAMCDHEKSCGYRDGLGRYLLTLAG